MKAALRHTLRWLRHGAALIGLVAVLAAVGLATLPKMRLQAEMWVLERLAQRALDDVDAESATELYSDPGAATRATALDPNTLPAGQAAVARALAKLYRVAPEPVAALVAEAYRIGPKLKLEPNLLLAVAAVESNFHPYIQSGAGAQGLMQIMPGIHRKRLEAEGGPQVAFDPIINLRIGARILHDCVKLRGGSTEEGLRFYLGGGRVGSETSDAYLKKINEIKAPLDQVATGRAAPP